MQERSHRPHPLLELRARWMAALWRPAGRLRALAMVSALALAALVLGLGALPLAVGLVPGGWDKAAHIALHFVLCHALLLAMGLRQGSRAVGLCALFAAVDEALQQLHPGRSVSLADWAASVSGAVFALATAHAVAWHAVLRNARRAAWLRRQMARWRQMPH